MIYHRIAASQDDFSPASLCSIILDIFNHLKMFKRFCGWPPTINASGCRRWRAPLPPAGASAPAPCPRSRTWRVKPLSLDHPLDAKLNKLSKAPPDLDEACRLGSSNTSGFLQDLNAKFHGLAKQQKLSKNWGQRIQLLAASLIDLDLVSHAFFSKLIFLKAGLLLSAAHVDPFLAWWSLDPSTGGLQQKIHPRGVQSLPLRSGTLNSEALASQVVLVSVKLLVSSWSQKTRTGQTSYPRS